VAELPALAAASDGDVGERRRVVIARPFAVGRYEVTIDQFAVFVDETRHELSGPCRVLDPANPPQGYKDSTNTFRDPGFPVTGQHPAVCLAWLDAKAYVAWLVKKTGKPYRLPSEAEWEHAARADSTTRFSFGDGASADPAHREPAPGQRDPVIEIAPLAGGTPRLTEIDGEIVPVQGDQPFLVGARVVLPGETRCEPVRLADVGEPTGEDRVGAGDACALRLRQLPRALGPRSEDVSSQRIRSQRRERRSGGPDSSQVSQFLTTSGQVSHRSDRLQA
jgi:hypothetical protein